MPTDEESGTYSQGLVWIISIKFLDPRQRHCSMYLTKTISYMLFCFEFLRYPQMGRNELRLNQLESLFCILVYTYPLRNGLLKTF